MTIDAGQKITSPFNEDILARTRGNSYFREVVSTGPHAQVVVMCIPPSGEIGEEVHNDVDQVVPLAELDGDDAAFQRPAVGLQGRLLHQSP